MVSIIIINFDTRELTQQCLQSICDRTRQITCEVIVLDNASTDGSADALFCLTCNRYHYIYNEENIGFSSANNKASRTGRGKYLFFMNSDMIFINDVLAVLTAYFKNHPTTGIAGPMFLNADGSLQVSCRNFPNITFGLLRFFPFFKFFFPQEAAAYCQAGRDYSKIQTVDTVSAGAMLINKSLFEEMGGFDEFSFMYGEDADICRRIRDKGQLVVFVPAARLIHFGGQSSQLTSYRAVWSYYFAFYYLYKKYYFGWVGILLKPFFLIVYTLGSFIPVNSSRGFSTIRDATLQNLTIYPIIFLLKSMNGRFGWNVN